MLRSLVGSEMCIRDRLRCMVAQASFDLGGVITVIMREMAPIGEMAPGCGKRSKKEVFNCISAPPSERWHQGAEKKSRNIFFFVFSHPHRRDGTGCDLNDVNPRVSATVPGPRGDIRASLLSRTISTGTCVISPRFLGVLWYCCTVFRRTDVPIGRCTAFWSCRCVFTYHMVCMYPVSYTHLTLPTIYSV